MASTSLKVDLCVLRASAGGLEVAVAARLAGQSVALVEERPLSPIIGFNPHLTSFFARQHHRQGGRWQQKSFRKQLHLARNVDSIDVAQLKAAGIHVFDGHAEFSSAKALRVGQTLIEAKRFAVFPSLKPRYEEFEGRQGMPFRGAAEFYDFETLPKSLLIYGGGRLAAEAALHYRQLNLPVTWLYPHTGPLPGFSDIARTEILRQFAVLKGEPVPVLDILKARHNKNGVTLEIETPGGKRQSYKAALLLDEGCPQLDYEAFNLSAAGIETPLAIDRRQRAKGNPNIIFLAPRLADWPDKSEIDRLCDIMLANAVQRGRMGLSPHSRTQVIHAEPDIVDIGITDVEGRKLIPPLAHIDITSEDAASASTRIQLRFNAARQLLGATLSGPLARETSYLLSVAIVGRKRLSFLLHGYPAYPSLAAEIREAVADYLRENPGRLTRTLQWLFRGLR